MLDEPGLPGLERSLELCPETTFIGHGPSFWAEISGEVPEELRWGYPTGPVTSGGAVPRLMRKKENLWADTSAGSGYNALTRDESFGLDFLEEFSQKLLFGIDSCLASDVERLPPIVTYFQHLREEKLLPEPVLEAICWRNAARLLDLPVREAL
jgi:predicted TIM-barrel fold metal-dependent hydrolase